MWLVAVYAFVPAAVYVIYILAITRMSFLVDALLPEHARYDRQQFEELPDAGPGSDPIDQAPDV
jgi:hypothetical protein